MHGHVVQALSLMALFGIDGSQFKAGLDKGVAEAKKAGPSLERSLFGALKQSRLFQIIASPIGAAAGLFTAFAAKVSSELKDLLERAKEIKKLSAETQLNKQSTQTVLYAAEGAGLDPEGVGKAILKIAEAQEKVRRGGAGAADALRAFSAMGVTLGDIKGKTYDQLFFQVAQSLNVAKQSGEQMTAGVELMGKAFETLEPLFKRGFNNPMDQMKMLTDEEVRKLDALNLRSAKLHAIWKEMWADLATHAGSGLAGLLGIGGNEDFEMDQDAAMKRNQAKIDARMAARAQKENAAAQLKLNREEESLKLAQQAAEERIKSEKIVHDLRAREHRGELNANQRIGAFAGRGAAVNYPEKQTNLLQRSVSLQEKLLIAFERNKRAQSDVARGRAWEAARDFE